MKLVCNKPRSAHLYTTAANDVQTAQRLIMHSQSHIYTLWCQR